ncbi:MAG: DNA polymerase III subunit beta [Gammaproteobacteria bacterium]|jgi:DNA polymerase-3 subunit beta
MNITIKQDLLLKALQPVSGVSDKKHQLTILGNVLIIAEKQKISFICSDQDLELITTINSAEVKEEGSITVSCRKLLDICKGLPENSLINLSTEENRVLIRANRSRFTLVSLPAADFPVVQISANGKEYRVSSSILHEMIEHTHFAMAQQDVRYYLNGMLFVFNPGLQVVVATDGHRLTKTKNLENQSVDIGYQVIVPRKTIIEVLKLIHSEPTEITMRLEENHIQFIHPQFTLTSKLIEGRFPDYHKVIPLNTEHQALINKNGLKQSLLRVAILSNEKNKGVRFLFNNNNLTIEAQNPEQEEATEELEIDYQGPSLEVAFNAHYILDVLNVVPSDQVKIAFTDPKNSVLLSAHLEDEESPSQYVVMPLRL